MSDLVKRLASIRDIDGNRAVGVGTLKEVEQLEAKVEELEKCMATPRIEDLETIEQLTAELIRWRAGERYAAPEYIQSLQPPEVDDE